MVMSWEQVRIVPKSEVDAALAEVSEWFAPYRSPVRASPALHRAFLSLDQYGVARRETAFSIHVFDDVYTAFLEEERRLLSLGWIGSAQFLKQDFTDEVESIIQNTYGSFMLGEGVDKRTGRSIDDCIRVFLNVELRSAYAAKVFDDVDAAEEIRGLNSALENHIRAILEAEDIDS